MDVRSRRRLVRVALLAVVLSALGLLVPDAPVAAQTAPEVAGDPDPSFSSDGRVTTDLGRGTNATRIEVQDDGKIVVAGTQPLTAGGRMFVARYQPDGTLDTTFSGDGLAYVDFSARYDGLGDLALLDDGKIVVVGASNYGARTALARLLPDGTLDTSFGVGGKRTTDFVAGTEFAEAVEVLDDGRLRLAGGAANQIALMGYQADGTVETAFSGDGLVRTNVVNGFEQAWGLAVAADGSMVVTGVAGPRGNEQVPVVRYLADGTLDAGFSGDGKLTVNYTPSHDDATDVALLDDGGVLIAGEADTRVALSRFLADGTPDPAFSGDGRQVVDLPGPYEFASDLLLRGDGTAMVAGHTGRQGGRMLLARFDSAGSLDPTFSGDGWTAVNFGAGWDTAWAVAEQADGRFVLAGAALDTTRVALARILAA
jgi:uncharacterized delta-60 repeat protein